MYIICKIHKVSHYETWQILFLKECTDSCFLWEQKQILFSKTFLIFNWQVYFYFIFKFKIALTLKFEVLFIIACPLATLFCLLECKYFKINTITCLIQAPFVFPISAWLLFYYCISLFKDFIILNYSFCDFLNSVFFLS